MDTKGINNFAEANILIELYEKTSSFIERELHSHLWNYVRQTKEYSYDEVKDPDDFFGKKLSNVIDSIIKQSENATQSDYDKIDKIYWHYNEIEKEKENE